MIADCPCIHHSTHGRLRKFKRVDSTAYHEVLGSDGCTAPHNCLFKEFSGDVLDHPGHELHTRRVQQNLTGRVEGSSDDGRLQVHNVSSSTNTGLTEVIFALLRAAHLQLRHFDASETPKETNPKPLSLCVRVSHE
jgi:hypothetical protein